MPPPPDTPSRLTRLRLRNDGLDTLEPSHPELAGQARRREGSLLRDLAFLGTGVVLGVGAMVVIGYRPEPHSTAALGRTQETLPLPNPGRPGDTLEAGSPTALAMTPMTTGLPPPNTVVVSAPAADGFPGDGASASTSANAGTAPGTDFPRPLPLLVPVQGIAAEKLVDTFTQARANGGRRHDAMDIMAAEGTPVMAADDGALTKLYTSKDGGLTLYQTAPGDRVVYYYAHLSAYAPGLAEGQSLTRGQLLGFVGHTGNAKAEAPHLHFAVYDMPPGAKWWQGQPHNPYPLLRPEAAAAAVAAAATPATGAVPPATSRAR